MPTLAIEGGNPVRRNVLPYGHHWLEEADVQAVVDVLHSDWLTTGPKVHEFEQAFANVVGTKEAVAVSNGTAALHTAMYAVDIGPGDSARGITRDGNIPRAEVIVPPMTFAATANCVVFQGGTPIFADVDPDTLLLDPAQVEKKITSRTKAIVAVDYAGQPCDYDALRAIADRHGLAVVADACHALGASYKGRQVGSLADLTVFSFYPVKHITTGEGGMITTDEPELARKMRIFRNHGITSDHHQRRRQGSWFYEMVELGYNYRITDFQCALGMSQLSKLSRYVQRRREIAARYDAAFTEVAGIQLVAVRPEVRHSYHLYVIKLDLDQLRVDREQVFAALRAEGIGVNVHYIPVHLHPFYRRRFATGPGLCPVSEAAYERLITLPIFPGMSDADIDDVIDAVKKVIGHYVSQF